MFSQKFSQKREKSNKKKQKQMFVNLGYIETNTPSKNNRRARIPILFTVFK